MQTQSINSSLDICEIPGKGKGVFATRSFAAEEIIEIAPLLIFSQEEEAHLYQTGLFNYAFAWGTEGTQSALALGYGSLYNHSYAPNAYYRRNITTTTLEIIALRAIEPGEEICFNYNCDPSCQEPLWFTVIN